MDTSYLVYELPFFLQFDVAKLFLNVVNCFPSHKLNRLVTAKLFRSMEICLFVPIMYLKVPRYY